jgi:hypothetical protein
LQLDGNSVGIGRSAEGGGQVRRSL